jgi:WD40 repeat protein
VPIYWLMISPNNRYVLGINKRGASIVWDIERGHLETIGRPGYSVYSAEFSPDGTRLSAPMNDRTVMLLDLESGRRYTLDGHRDLVYDVGFSPDGATLASASYDRTVRLWDGVTGAPLQVLRGHTAAVHRVVFSPDGRMLASAADDRTVRLWEMSALPSADPSAVRERIAQATSARIDNGLVVSPSLAD